MTTCTSATSRGAVSKPEFALYGNLNFLLLLFFHVSFSRAPVKKYFVYEPLYETYTIRILTLYGYMFFF